MRVSMYIPEKGHNGRDGQNAQDLVDRAFRGNVRRLYRLREATRLLDERPGQDA